MLSLQFYNSDIKILNLEASSFCNAKCPMCLRECHSGDYSFFKQTNLTLEFLKKRLSANFIRNLDQIVIEGVMGDPAMNKQLPYIVEWIFNNNPSISLSIHTNGGAQPTAWWIQLGTVLGRNGTVLFSIDGLSDTNHIYRKNVNWDRLMDNAKSFISSGATAVWRFIPFRHNEHQIELAEELSKKMRFSKFEIKISYRFAIDHPKHLNSNIEEPINPKFKHSTNVEFTKDYLNNSQISCYAIEEKSLYISAEGLVFPCCHLASLKFVPESYFPDNFKHIDETKIDLSTRSLDNILKSQEFLSIKNSWMKTVELGRNPMCSLICGRNTNSASTSDVRYYQS